MHPNTLSFPHSSAVISHSKPRILGIRKRHPAGLGLTRNLNPIRHQRTTSCRIDHKLGRSNRAALQCNGAEERLLFTGGSVDVDGAGARRGDGIAGGEVHLELAAVGAGRHVVEGQGVGDGVCAPGVLVDVEVDGEADAAGVGDGAGTAGESGGWSWGGAGEEGGAEESGGG